MLCEQHPGKEAKLKKWLRPYLVEKLGFIAGRNYDKREEYGFNSEVILPPRTLGYDNPGYFTIGLHITPEREALKVEASFRPVQNGREQELYVMCDALLLEAGEQCHPAQAQNYWGTTLHGRLEHFGKDNRSIIDSQLHAKNLGAIVAAIDFMKETHQNMQQQDIAKQADLPRFAYFRRGLLHHITAGTLPSQEGQWEELKALYTAQLTAYETALRSFFPK